MAKMSERQEVRIKRGSLAGRTGCVVRVIPAGYGVKRERVEVRLPDGASVSLASTSVEAL